MSGTSSPNSRRCRVALIGSSGGGAATLGCTSDPSALLSEIQVQFEAADLELAAVQLVWCKDPLDSASQEACAALWCCSHGGGNDNDRDVSPGAASASCANRGPLRLVNESASKSDAEIACAIRQHRIDALVAVSADVGERGVNRAAFDAAAANRIPVTGTGGTSLAAAAELGVQLVGAAGGSVATTPFSKAVAATAALAGHFGIPYVPASPAAASSPALHSLLDGGLPAFVAVALARLGLHLWCLAHERGEPGWWSAAQSMFGILPQWGSLGPPVRLRELSPHLGATALPPVVGAVAAHQTAGLGDVAAVSGAVAGALGSPSVVAALFGGLACGRGCPRALAFLCAVGWPATAATVSSLGLGAMAIGLPLRCFASWLCAASASLRSVLLMEHRPWHLRALVGAGVGAMVCGGSKTGWYHAAFLPLILLEMEDGCPAVLGAHDACALCAVSAGICAAQLVVPRKGLQKEGEVSDVALARRGLRINFWFGDFIEAAYPFMERDPFCSLAGYVGAGLGGAIVAVGRVRSSAYIPLPLACILAGSDAALSGRRGLDALLTMMVAVASSFGVPFVVCVARNLSASWCLRSV